MTIKEATRALYRLGFVLGVSFSAAGALPASRVTADFSEMAFAVQLPDSYVATGRYKQVTPYLKELGVQFVRVDMNWPAIETSGGVYRWDMYDRLAADFRRNQVKPIFILNRPNGAVQAIASPMPSLSSPTTSADQESFGRWAAAAAVRYRDLAPVWELWNEPDDDSFWPPKSDPTAYLKMALTACRAIRNQVSEAVIVGPTAARMPTIWKGRGELWDALEKSTELLQCLSGVSFHTHRFKQNPETVLRDYAVFRDSYPAVWNAATRSGIYVTEWGDSVRNGGIKESDQATWLVRMMLLNISLGIRLTNYYCLVDTGSNADELEDRFGLLTEELRRRPAFTSYAHLISNLRGMHLVSTFNGIAGTAQGSFRMVFCNAQGVNCLMAAWRTEATRGREKLELPGWGIDGAGTDFLGNPRVSAFDDYSPDGAWLRVSRKAPAAGAKAS